MSYTTHDYFYDKFKPVDIKDYALTSGPDASIEALFKILSFEVRSYGDQSTLDSFIANVLEDLFTIKGIKDLPSKMKYILKAISPCSDLTLLKYEENTNTVKIKFEVPQKKSMVKRCAQYLKHLISPPKVFKIQDLLAQIKKLPDTEDSCTSPLDAFNDYVKSLKDPDTLMKIALKALYKKYDDDFLSEVPNTFELLFNICIYFNNYQLLKAKYNNKDSVVSVDYTNTESE